MAYIITYKYIKQKKQHNFKLNRYIYLKKNNILILPSHIGVYGL